MNQESTLWDKVTAVASAVLAVTGILALWFAYAQIRESHRQSQIQHLDEMVRRFDESPMIEARRALAQARIDEKQETLRPLKPDDPPKEMETILNFFEYVGLLEQSGYLDKEDVWSQFSYYFFAFYTDAQPVISEVQKTEGSAVWEDVQSLMNDLEKVDSQMIGHPSESQTSQTTQKDLYDFYKGEAQVQTHQPLPRVRRKRK